MLPKDLLAVLACPHCRGDLTLLDEDTGLSCSGCTVVYPIVDGIPVLLKDKAVPRADWDAGARGTVK